MKRLIIFLCLIVTLCFTGCNHKQDRIDHADSNYIYVYKYHDNDSTLVKYHQPQYREYPVVGGHHKHHHVKVDYMGDGIYRCVRLPYNVDRCAIVNKAQHATYDHPLIGVFKISEYPSSDIEFVKYK